MERHISDGGFSGGGLVVWQRGKVVAEHFAGEAAPGVPSGPRVLWPIASISKV